MIKKNAIINSSFSPHRLHPHLLLQHQNYHRDEDGGRDHSQGERERERTRFCSPLYDSMEPEDDDELSASRVSMNRELSCLDE